MPNPMIVSASYRTDIPAFYGDWFRRRLAAGYALVRNPYGGPDSRVDLRPEAVGGYIFWSRNLATFGEVLAEVAGQGVPFVVQMTITGYPRALESAVVAPERAIAQLHRIAETYGPRAAVWRYDPILATSLTPPDWHRGNVAALARQLEGVVDEVVVSWATIYRKTERNMRAAAEAHGFQWSDPPDDDKRTLLTDLAEIASAHGMAMTLCSQPHLLVEGVTPARCVDAGRLSDIAGRPIIAKQKGNRPGCDCAASRDIGAYDTCPHGCVYCYAVQNRPRAQARFKAQDPDSPMLGDEPRGAPTAPQRSLFNTDA
jgi:hypothetical protein